MRQHPVVSREEWLKARKAHLKNEKALTRMRDQNHYERLGVPELVAGLEFESNRYQQQQFGRSLFNNGTMMPVSPCIGSSITVPVVSSIASSSFEGSL